MEFQTIRRKPALHLKDDVFIFQQFHIFFRNKSRPQAIIRSTLIDSFLAKHLMRRYFSYNGCCHIFFSFEASKVRTDKRKEQSDGCLSTKNDLIQYRLG